ncbi:MAG: phosphosulfolactate synthase [Bacteroidales bacterium]|nr:phosphosulfolactate synthase [Bacteroidales bacterium]
MIHRIPFLPKRTDKPRNAGISMIIDKGLSSIEAQGMADACEKYIDFVKFGFGTALISPNLKEKIAIYKNAGIIPYCGGSLFEIFILRNMYSEFVEYIKSLELTHVEVSDGSITLDHKKKLQFIEKLSLEFTVISEVGYKTTDRELTDDEWTKMMLDELSAGSWKVIGEARESGTIGIYNADGSPNRKLIDGILEKVPADSIIWEAPQKAQQAMFIKLIGSEVNLGNISTSEVIALEALRQGLRGDTFFEFIPKSYI